MAGKKTKGSGSPYLALGEVTNLCLATSSATVDLAVPSAPHCVGC